MLQALIWDVDGTIAETERDGHRVAFNGAFESLGLPWRWSDEDYGRLLRVTGGRERLLHDMATRPQAPTQTADREALAARLHARKNALYADIVAQGRLPARPGVLALMREAHQAGLRQAIATTTSRANVVALMSALLGAGWELMFAAVVCGEDVVRKKPDPAVYLQALEALRLPARACLALEDSAPGLAAARAARVPVLVTRSVYFGDLDGAVALWCGASLAELGAPTTASAQSLLAAVQALHDGADQGQFSSAC